MKKIITLHLLVMLFMTILSAHAARSAAPPSGYFNMISRNVWELTQVPNIATETGRIKTSLQVADFEPVGLRATANTQLVINVEQTSGTGLPRLIMGTYDRQTVATYDLVAGVNTITNANGGDLYLQYSSASPSDGNKVRVTFQSGYHTMPLYILGSSTHQQWLDMLVADTSSPNATLVSDRTFIVVSQVKAEQYKDENQDTLLTLMDRVMQAEGDISGLDNSLPVHAPILRNKLMLLEKASGNPDATSLGRVRIPTGSIHWILSPSYILEDGGWGVFHEIGHHHQHWAWTWSTCIEVCVNIYSLAAKRAIHFGQQGMSTADWNTVMSYLAQPQASKNFNAGSVSLFTRLGMFHQLWLAYGDSFYHTLHKRTRAEAPSPSGDEAEMRLFMLYACQISGENLGQFFRNWGLNVNQSIYDELDALGYPAPAVDPSALREDLVATITSPANNAVFPAGSGVTLTATAFGQGKIANVEFFQGTVKLGEDSTAPYEYAWNNTSPGSYTLTAKATAASGQTATSSPVNIVMESVSITSPANNASFPAGEPVQIDASVSGAVGRVEFYADSIKIGEATAAPYSFSWQNAPAGIHTLTAKAIDLNGDTATSTSTGIVTGGLFPAADAYVRDGGSANTNFGTAHTLVVKKDGNSGYSRVSYLKFDLNGYNNPGIATLRLYITGAGTAASGTQWQVWKNDNDTWTETGITWNNKPVNSTQLASQQGRRSGYVEWDISSQVAQESAGDKVLSIAIVSSVSGQTNDATFASKEATEAALRPVLMVDAFPAVTLLQPAANDTLPEHGAMLITASASDDRHLDSLTLYINGEEKTQFTQTPYEWNWADLQPGTYGIRAKATDNAGLQTWSDSLTVSVVKDTIPPALIAPAAITANPLPGASDVAVNIGNATATDNAGIASLTHNAPAVFPVGETTVTWTATDLSGNISTATQLVTVNYLKSKFGAVTLYAGSDGNNLIDLKAQLYVNGTLAGTGELLQQNISGNGLGNCNRFIIPIDSDSVTYTPSDVLQLKIYARRAGNSGNFRMKFWYNAEPSGGISKGTAKMEKYTPVIPGGDGFFYLREQFALQPSAGGEAVKTSLNVNAGYQEIGTWSAATLEPNTISHISMAQAEQPRKQQGLEVKIFPNPSSYEFGLLVGSATTLQVRVRVMDISGKVISAITGNPGQLVYFGQELKPGLYIVEVTQGNKREIVKVIKK
ncbi:Ig-like domain-containing protein [Chitinophaga sp. GCM10012297]|uniref:M60 family metallopeptidase n=1 Tax=Chitinophaga chungangae TaxID=2821488 RepID=A0ABS3YKP9_9BACT|nr:Ig-like domain-containing protein [Chitinophaga chungangae]MBO9154990.1 M60 family metallopeptidase [Chitinophaga chungangae]